MLQAVITFCKFSPLQKERHITQREGEILAMKGKLETMRRASLEQQKTSKLHLANAKQEAQVSVVSTATFRTGDKGKGSHHGK